VKQEPARRHNLALQLQDIVANGFDRVVEEPIVVAPRAKDRAREHMVGCRTLSANISETPSSSVIRV